jgi:hypothetical protein
MLSHLWANASHSEGFLELLHHACTCIIPNGIAIHAPAINTADSPRRHQCVYQLIKPWLSTIVQSAYNIPSTTGMTATPPLSTTV